MKTLTINLTILALATSLITACAHEGNQKPISSNHYSTNLISATSNTAIGLNNSVHINKENKPITIVTTFVESETLQASSAFGRTLSEQISGHLAQLNFPVIEVRLRKEILVRNNTGELMLSRELKDLAKQHDAETVVVGTYTESATRVYVNTKMIRLDDSQIISANSFVIDKNSDVASLLHGVKHEDLYGKDTNQATQNTLFETIKEYDRQINLKRKIH